MVSMVERMAQALAERSGARWDKVSEEGPRGEADWGTRGYWRDLARAAIEAMREPTPGMIKAADLVEDGYTFQRPDFCWLLMINAALSEHPSPAEEDA